MDKFKTITTVPFLALMLLGGGMVAGYASLASADVATDSTSASPTSMVDKAKATFDKHLGGHIGQNGVKEELLTGETAEKVTAAALAAIPDGTIDRVETDAEGAVYEAHMTKADGSEVNLKFDAEYKLTATEEGHKGGMGRGHGHRDMPATVSTATPAPVQ